MVLRKIVILAGVFVSGTFLGSLALAALGALEAPDDEFSRRNHAYDVLDAFDARARAGVAMNSSMDFGGAVSDCGYDPDRLFGPELSLAVGQAWTPYTGYFDLTIWQRNEFSQEVARRRAEHLSRHLGAFELVFLDRCIRSTLFAGQCALRVHRLLETGNLRSRNSMPASGPRFVQSRRDRTICTYLDGLAARKGLPLSARPGPEDPPPE